MCHDLREPTGWAAVPDKQRTKRWHDGPGLKENDPSRWMTADAIVERGGRRWVLDAKYKREYATEGRNDRFQATTYALAFEAHRASLVYPTATGTGPNCRMLLAGGVQGRPVTIDSIELPMGVGPEACWRAFLKVGKGVG
jgi:hypothetical protein